MEGETAHGAGPTYHPRRAIHPPSLTWTSPGGGLAFGGVKRASAILLVGLAACAESSPLAGREIGPPESGWSAEPTRAGCAPDDVAPRLHFAKVSHLGWMSARERIALAGADVGHTEGGEEAALERIAIDGAVRRMAPIALEAAGEPELATVLRASPPIDARQDAIARVARARGEATTEGGEQILAVLEAALREAGAPFDRCEEIAAGDTVESAMAVAAVRAGAPRAQITREAVALLEQMASASRAS